MILSKAPLMAIAPNFVDDTPAYAPPNAPKGVLTAETIYTSLLMIFVFKFLISAPNVMV